MEIVFLQREPMKSWMMERWKQRKGNESDFPDLNIRQEEDASHVLGEEEHPSTQDIEKMCLEGFFTEHGYRYVRDEGNENGENLKMDESGCTPEYRIGSCAERHDKENMAMADELDCHIYDDVTPKLGALQPPLVPPRNYATVVKQTDLKDKHQSSTEGDCQDVPQQKATQKTEAKGHDKGREPKSLQDLLNEHCTEFEYLI